MSSFLLKKRHMREALLFCFNLKKSAAELHWMLVEAYGDNALSETTCRDSPVFMTTILIWVTRSVKIGPGWGLSIAGSFGRGRYPIAKNVYRAIECFSSSHFYAAMPWKVQKIGKWVPHKLNDRQMKRRQNTCQILLARQKRKSFLHRIDRRWKVDLFSES